LKHEVTFSSGERNTPTNPKAEKMIEDDVYRSSSQYRYWSYTKESLARIRQKTNDLASERVRAAFRRVQASKSSSHNNGDISANGSSPEGTGAKAPGDAEVQTLTVDEELKIVEWGCQKIMDMGEAMTPRVPSAVVVRCSSLRYNLDSGVNEEI
jgi:cyclin H